MKKIKHLNELMIEKYDIDTEKLKIEVNRNIEKLNNKKTTFMEFKNKIFAVMGTSFLSLLNIYYSNLMASIGKSNAPKKIGKLTEVFLDNVKV